MTREIIKELCSKYVIKDQIKKNWVMAPPWVSQQNGLSLEGKKFVYQCLYESNAHVDIQKEF